MGMSPHDVLQRLDWPAVSVKIDDDIRVVIIKNHEDDGDFLFCGFGFWVMIIKKESIRV